MFVSVMLRLQPRLTHTTLNPAPRPEDISWAKCGDIHLQFRHLGSRGREISRLACMMQWDHVSQKPKKKIKQINKGIYMIYIHIYMTMHTHNRTIHNFAYIMYVLEPSWCHVISLNSSMIEKGSQHHKIHFSHSGKSKDFRASVPPHEDKGQTHCFILSSVCWRWRCRWLLHSHVMPPFHLGPGSCHIWPVQEIN